MAAAPRTSASALAKPTHTTITSPARAGGSWPLVSPLALARPLADPDQQRPNDAKQALSQAEPGAEAHGTSPSPASPSASFHPRGSSGLALSNTGRISLTKGLAVPRKGHALHPSQSPCCGHCPHSHPLRPQKGQRSALSPEARRGRHRHPGQRRA